MGGRQFSSAEVASVLTPADAWEPRTLALPCGPAMALQQPQYVQVEQSAQQPSSSVLADSVTTMAASVDPEEPSQMQAKEF